MNAEEKKKFEEIQYWISNGSCLSQSLLMWLCSKLEEAQAELAKVKGQRDRLRENVSLSRGILRACLPLIERCASELYPVREICTEAAEEARVVTREALAELERET